MCLGILGRNHERLGVAGTQNVRGGGKHLVWSGNARGMLGFPPSLQGFSCVVTFEMGVREISFLKLWA